ncbi:BatA domain-containing protein [Mesonia aestuariivivens]|uniref:BatA domain-containing protein n=1 Tax=Mesonia aestuariivivens TaxID=2796128 RepID=A0ABS6W5M2_9FLAO|nr:BatA domain-containing protein [Mesonia aestuariivivens]MBW2962786.1 BatA domain-containing protein [Mesonia aestuariivivens]
MLLKNPQILYALFLLIIPVIVHLFQLRKFKKEQFTNVKFLKKVQLQTRKSSKIKKWLTLLARLLGLACIIFAFAQPYLPETSQSLKKKETVIYLDNSFSMQQKGKNGELLKNAIQSLLTALPEDYHFSLLTNDEIYKNTTKQELAKELQQINYSSNSPNFKTTYIKAKKVFSKHKNTLKKFVAISDFQEQNLKDLEFDAQLENTLIQLQPEKNFNISIDSVFVKDKNIENTTVQVNLSSSTATDQLFTVSLFDHHKLLAKSSVNFDDNTKANTTFSIPTSQDIKGVLAINDNSLQYDNSLYFSLQQNEKINVASISDAKDNFLKKIFNQDEFNLITTQSNQINYNKLSHQNLIILNELKSIPQGLANILSKHLENGGSLSIIPAETINEASYNRLFNALNLSRYQKKQTEELKITNINFSNIVFENVFNKKVRNFDYPKVNSHYYLNTGANQILSYNNGQPFLKQIKQVFLFTAAINKENSNFKQSPLIVPTFYNIAKQSLQLPQLYYVNENNNTIEVKVKLDKDNVIKIKDSSKTFIPLQQHFANKVNLTLQNEPKSAGNYSVIANDKTINLLSFNYNRRESKLNYANLSSYKHIKTQDSITNFFSQEINDNQMNFFWKWFVIFALLFLVIEFLFLKFLK